MAQKRILLVEDEKNLFNTIKLNLELENFEVVGVTNGAEVMKNFKPLEYDLIVLDVMLPEVDGFTLCETIRHYDKQTPILFLTAKNSGVDRVQGLRLGADDYLTKPFILEELLLRVNNLIKRSLQLSNLTETQFYEFGQNKVNFLTYEIVGVNCIKATLSKKEIALLKLLINRKNEVISRDFILDEIWGENSDPTSRTIDNYILAFRKYFEIDPKNPIYFHSIRSVGYKFSG